MTEYRLYFNNSVSSVVTVEAESIDEAVDLAYDELPTSLCASCEGWGSQPGVSLDGEWIVDDVAAREDYPDG